ncbi:MBL fold metallo-hydrolase [Syntrophorhabdus aromaticivorans]|uniref:MBL fold metallo-hydrolase n=1 Tax=Syntrophorhabdus aromaticivorans TaxID=328301 RepID=A0A351U5E0_9BACT|nr:MBL fold metallo-hydrolase [Syntrophorhabdus aromaticivorans]NLW34513.1 MBL fold metallo-hydrolase [Syntrophorhabdus aromaticivorans]HBA55171.1 MBL fold hydrolase [Syntrophorhabdus aromaticivorans]
MTKVSEGVYFIQGQDEFLPDSHVYIIGEPGSNDLSMVDVGLTGKGGYKVQAIRKLGIEPDAVKRIIMTHTHLDHIGCLSEVKKEIPGAELWVHTLEADPLEAGDDRGVYGMNEFKGMCRTQYGLKADAFKFKVDRKLEGGESLSIGNMTWEVIHIPGHSMGGIALYNRPGRILIPGDVIYADYAIGRFDLHGADARQLRKSLMNLTELDVDILLPGHNNIIKGLPSGYIGKVAKMWEPYLM